MDNWELHPQILLFIRVSGVIRIGNEDSQVELFDRVSGVIGNGVF